MRTRRLALRRLGVAGLLVLAGCGTHASAGSGQSTTPAMRSGASARLVLPATSLRTGGTMSGRIVVENDTGRPIRFTGCGSVFQLLLRGTHYAQTAIWPACATPMSVPVGTSSYRVTIRARYSTCSPTAQPPDPACGPHDSIPALPPGRYAVSTVAATSTLPVPPIASISITR